MYNLGYEGTIILIGLNVENSADYIALINPSSQMISIGIEA
jgi:hypothetical protein